jgi:hypothetical protein
MQRNVIFGAIVFHFQAIGKSTGQRFCEMLVQCCDGGLLERKQKISYSTGDLSAAIANND